MAGTKEECVWSRKSTRDLRFGHANIHDTTAVVLYTDMYVHAYTY